MISIYDPSITYRCADCCEISDNPWPQCKACAQAWADYAWTAIGQVPPRLRDRDE